MAKALNYHSDGQTPLYGVSLIFSLYRSLVYKIIALKDTAGVRGSNVQWRKKTLVHGERASSGRTGMEGWVAGDTQVPRGADGAGTSEGERK